MCSVLLAIIFTLQTCFPRKHLSVFVRKAPLRANHKAPQPIIARFRAHIRVLNVFSLFRVRTTEQLLQLHVFVCTSAEQYFFTVFTRTLDRLWCLRKEKRALSLRHNNTHYAQA